MQTCLVGLGRYEEELLFASMSDRSPEQTAHQSQSMVVNILDSAVRT